MKMNERENKEMPEEGLRATSVRIYTHFLSLSPTPARVLNVHARVQGGGESGKESMGPPSALVEVTAMGTAAVHGTVCFREKNRIGGKHGRGNVAGR